jgi:hypothetical protein
MSDQDAEDLLLPELSKIREGMEREYSPREVVGRLMEGFRDLCLRIGIEAEVELVGDSVSPMVRIVLPTGQRYEFYCRKLST